MYRTIILCIFQGALDKESFWQWNQTGLKSLREQLARGEQVIRIDFNGRKKFRNRKPYFTFLGTDATNALRAYLEVRPDAGDAIFYSQSGTPVNKNSFYLYWLRHLEKAGYINRQDNMEGRGKRYGFNPHEMRDVWRSQWEKSSAKGSVAEYCMGHVGDPLGYEKASSDPKWARSEYVKVLPFLNIISNPLNEEIEAEISKVLEKNLELEARLKRLEAVMMNLDDDDPLIDEFRNEQPLRNDPWAKQI